MPPVNEPRRRRLRIALILNLAIVVLQIAAGFVARSLGLLADAGHNLTDAAAIGLSLLAVGMVSRRPTERRSFGYHRASILAAQANAVSILAITVFVLYEGTRRLLNPEKVNGPVVVVISLLTAAANFAAARIVAEHHGHGGHGDQGGHGGHAGHGEDLNVASARLHLMSDAAASLGVAAAGLVITLVHGAYWLDPAISMVIGVVIAVHAWRLLRSVLDVLLESTPHGLDVLALRAAMAGVGGVEEVHDLHVWSLSSDVRALSAHIVVEGHPSLEDAQVVASQVKAAIATRFSIAHATIEVECETCAPDGDPCVVGDFDLHASTAGAHAGHAH